jgi:hypothetical protein
MHLGVLCHVRIVVMLERVPYLHSSRPLSVLACWRTCLASGEHLNQRFFCTRTLTRQTLVMRWTVQYSNIIYA